jgi:hypothetical protein
VVVDPWVPGAKVTLLPGKTGNQLAKAEVAILLGLFPLLAILVAGMAITGARYASSPLLTLVMILVVCDVVSSFVVSALCDRKLRAEARAGYTTSVRRFNDVAEVEVRTGYVIRAAGEPPLTRDRYDERAARIHAHIEQTRSQP